MRGAAKEWKKLAEQERKTSKRRLRWILLGAIVLLLAFDMSRAPRSQASARLLLLAIGGYQAVLSPRLPSLGVQCRFTPTCSHYAEESIRRHGAFKGMGRALGRVARCGPWTPLGTIDPPR